MSAYEGEGEGVAGEGDGEVIIVIIVGLMMWEGGAVSLLVVRLVGSG